MIRLLWLRPKDHEVFAGHGRPGRRSSPWAGPTARRPRPGSSLADDAAPPPAAALGAAPPAPGPAGRGLPDAWPAGWARTGRRPAAPPAAPWSRRGRPPESFRGPH